MSQKVVNLMLEKLGYRVITANDGKEAQEKYFENPQQFSCVILDCQMPRQSGAETAVIIRKENKKIPIVMLTAHATSKDKEESIEAGANLFLTKPVTLVTMKESLQHTLHL